VLAHLRQPDERISADERQPPGEPGKLDDGLNAAAVDVDGGQRATPQRGGHVSAAAVTDLEVIVPDAR